MIDLNRPSACLAQSSQLWAELQDFSLDDSSAAMPFSKRLARENGWSHEFALRVIEEYKRFVFLAMTTGHTVSPSDQVDQAWHLHLTYTKSYWNELCNKVLGRPLHHGPTQGGNSETHKFEELYRQTLASYRQAFGEPAPEDIWPPVGVRFSEASEYVRVSKHRNWIVAKPHRSRRSSMAMMGLTGLGVAALPVATLEDWLTFPWVLLVGLGIAVVLRLVLGKGGGGSGCGGFFGCGDGCGSGCGGGCGGD